MVIVIGHNDFPFGGDRDLSCQMFNLDVYCLSYCRERVYYHTLHTSKILTYSLCITKMKLIRSLLAVHMVLFASGSQTRAAKFETAPLKVPISSASTTQTLEIHKLKNVHTLIDRSRGGARGRKQPVPVEMNQDITVRTLVLAAFEAAGLLGVIAGSEVIAPTTSKWLEKLSIPSSINGLSVVQWIALIFVIFSSNTMKSWVQGGISTATKQSLQPNVVPGDQEWYVNLNKPWFHPPGWAFPIMWLLVSKPTQLIAASKIVKSDVSTKYWPVLAVYCTHLSLGDAWNEVFFGSQRIGLGAVVITTFFGLLIGSATLFFGVDGSAGKFMLPTCAWVFVATALNLSIYVENK